MQSLLRTLFVLSLAAGSARAQTAESKPADAPPRGLRLADPAALAGYTLFAPLASGTTYLVDDQGRVVHRWETKLPTGASVYLLDDGHLLRTVRVVETPRFSGGGLGGRLQEFDFDGQPVWDFTFSSDAMVLHHDVARLPNGHLLAIAWENVSRDEGLELGRDPKGIGDKGWWPDAILEIEPAPPSGGKIVWEWHAKDHLIQDLDRSRKNFGSVADHPELIDVNVDTRAAPALTHAQIEERKQREREMAKLGYTGGKDDSSDPKPGDAKPIEPDWMHTNAVNYLPEQDLIVASSPHLSEIYVIDHSTSTAQARTHEGGRWHHGGDLLYRWGNPSNWGAGAKTDQTLFGQHDPKWIASGVKAPLAITVFNNGLERPDGKYSSIEELELPFDPAQGFVRARGQAFGPSAPRWRYIAPEKESLYSFFISGAQRLSNGDTLVCVGSQGRFLEVTREGKVVWEYWNPFGGDIPISFGNASDRTPQVDAHAVFRATRIPKDAPALKGRKLEPLG